MKPTERKPFRAYEPFANISQMVGCFPYITTAIRAQMEYEKTLASIAALTGDINKKAEELVAWYRNEYMQRPDQYPGDLVPVEMLKNRIASTAETIDAAIKFVKGKLEEELKSVDEDRLIRAGFIYFRNLNID